ncbi:unnamed protein product [Phytophthora fragariaefolia]|uniref:Unnamed protein product n=1 Tax=Phytophthora fragariaefolia TaxID=1490495 RepID=A0A9W7DDM7_9STRA|nr:unnamed protein product [Phytophthora fragariaefolia]
MAAKLETEEDTRTVSSEGSVLQCVHDAADSEDEFVDAVEPPSSTSGVLITFDGVAPPLSGVYEDALEATEQQVAAALQSTSSDGSGDQSTIQEEDGERKTEPLGDNTVEDKVAEKEKCAQVEVEVAAVVKEIVNNLTVENGTTCDEVEDDAGKDSASEIIGEANSEVLEYNTAPCQLLETVNNASLAETVVNQNVSITTCRNLSVLAPDEGKALHMLTMNGASEDVLMDEEATMEDRSDKVEKTTSEGVDSLVREAGIGNSGSSSEQAPTACEVFETTSVDATFHNAKVEMPAGKETINCVGAHSKTTSLDASGQNEPGDEAIESGNPSNDSIIETAAGDKIAVAGETVHAAAVQCDDQHEPAVEEVIVDEHDMDAIALELNASAEDRVAEVADEESPKGTEQEPAQPEENVDTVQPDEPTSTDAEADNVLAANDLVEAVHVEENQHDRVSEQAEEVGEAEAGSELGVEAAIVDAEPESKQPDANLTIPENTGNSTETILTSANVVEPEHNPAEEETEVSPALKEVPNSSRRKSSDNHEHNLAPASLLPRLALEPSSGATTATTIEPFVLTAESLEVHFPPQRFSYEVFGFSIKHRVVFYHIHKTDRRTGIRDPAILKRYSDFRELEIQLLETCLRAAFDLPRIPRPHLGTVIRGYKSKKTIEIREKAFRAQLRYIAQYPELHGSPIFERFITTSRFPADAGWM